MSKIVNNLGKFIAVHPILFYILSFTWGILMTLIGYLVLLCLLPFGKLKKYDHQKKYHEYLILQLNTNKGYGFSIGNVIFISKDSFMDSESYYSMVDHEIGHTIHNCIFGPFVIFLVYIPSMIRFHMRRRYFKKHGKHPKSNYDEIWFEGTATQIGTYYYDYHINGGL